MNNMIILTIVRKVVLYLTIIISASVLFVTNLFASELYDLCYRADPLNNGKILFLRHRNPTRDPVIRTYEIHLFDPLTGNLSYLQRYQELIYIPPVISRDRTSMVYHSIIEGTDFLVTKNIETGRSTRLRFDTGGYFVTLGLDYDNDTVAAVIKRGENKQAVYLISKRASTIRRILNGTNFIEIGFLDNRNIYYVEMIDGSKVLSFTNERRRSGIEIAEGVDYVQKAPNGDAILYSKGKDLYLFRVNGKESINLSNNFNRENYPPIFSSDGSTLALFENDVIHIVNVSSGDILYYLSMNTENITTFLTNYTLYIAKDNKVFNLKHKKPGQSLMELYEDDSQIHILSISPDDRYLVYQKKNNHEVIIFDFKENKHFIKELGFMVQRVIFPLSGDSFYVILLNDSGKDRIPVRELYLYNFKKESIFAISALTNTDIKLYFRKNNL